MLLCRYEISPGRRGEVARLSGGADDDHHGPTPRQMTLSVRVNLHNIIMNRRRCASAAQQIRPVGLPTIDTVPASID
jgi:hypothetical protein